MQGVTGRNYVKDILIYPNKNLRKESVELLPETSTKEDIDTLHTIAKSMYDLMVRNNGIGLAAPQIGIQGRLLVMNVNHPYFMVDPVITDKSEETFRSREGCLSIPGYFDYVTRHKKVTVQFKDVAGVEQTRNFSDLEAACLQHEVDHLDGVLFIDHISETKLPKIKKKIEIWKRRNKYHNLRVA